MKLEDYMLSLEKELGTILDVREWCPGVYCLYADRGGMLLQEFYVVLDDAPMAAKVQNYGYKMDGLRLYAIDIPASGWQIVQYEINKYRGTAKGNLLPEWLFRNMSLHAMKAHPEYFGTFPVPYHTPDGYTLRYRTLDNGIYWLESSTYRELLAVCSPIWIEELSHAAAALHMAADRDVDAGIKEAMDYIFFTEEASCVPIYELMMTRQEWDGTIIHRSALMNALWEYAPEYVIRQADGKHMIGMFSDQGTDFLLLK